MSAQMKTVDQRVKDAIEAQNKPVDGWAIRGKIRMARRIEVEDEDTRRANVADFRVGLITFIMLVGFVVYQIWEMTQ